MLTPPIRRPARFRPVLTLSLATLILLVCWVGLELWIAWTIKPTIQKNYAGMLREAVAAWQDTSGVNGWDALIEAAQRHKEHTEQYEDEELGTRWFASSMAYEPIINPEEHRRFYTEYDSSGYTGERLERLLALHLHWATETLAMHDELGITAATDAFLASGYALTPIPDSDVEQNLEFFMMMSPIRHFSFSPRARMFLAQRAEDWEAYAHHYETSLRIARAVANQPGLFSWQLGIAIASLAHGKVIDDLHGGLIPDETIIRIREINSRVGPMGRIERSVDAERYIMLDLYQSYFGHGGRLIETKFAELAPMEGDKHWISNVSGLWQPRWPHRERQIHGHHDEMLRILALPFAERERERPEKRPKSLADRIENPEDDDRPLPMFDPTLTFEERFLTTDHIFDFADQSLRFRSDEDGFAQILALEAFRIERGGYPESLAELVPEYLDALPVDLCTPDLRLWVYRRFDAPDESGRPYILYSVGFDAEDNGGVRPTGYHSRAMDRKHPGTDHVLSHPPLPEPPEEPGE